MTWRALLTAWLLLAAAGSLSCGSAAQSLGSLPDAGGSISCGSDNPCGSGLVCVASVCVPRAKSIANLAIEIAPPPGSDAAFTELPAADVSTDPLVLTASSSVALTIAFTSSAMPPTRVPATASVILTAPSLIPGRPSLSFQTNLTLSATTAMLLVPDGIRGRHASITLLPIAPADQTSPPFAFDVDVPTSSPGSLTLDLDLPAASYTISGTLVDSLNAGKGLFYARAFEMSPDPLKPGDLIPGDLISTKPLTADNTPSATAVPGHFVMLLPAQIGSQPITATPISVELTPTGFADPWFRFKPMMLDSVSTDLGSIALPVYSNVNAFQVTVHGTDQVTGLEEAIAGASVRAYTKMDGGDARGSTMFLRDATTDATGTANFTVIPGATGNPRSYALSVVPPPGSQWATTCLDGVPVEWNGMTAVPTLLLDVPLSRRWVVSGTVLTASGTPLGNVVVKATRAPAATIPCLPGAASTAVTTDARGSFTLPLDPGSYQFDYDPPDGSPAPRLTEQFDVNDNMVRPVSLPSPVLIEGNLVAGTPPVALPNATIRMFEAGTTPPLLRAQTQSNGMGHFRVVVAAPPGK